MGCTWSGINVLYNVVSSGTEVWVNERCFRIIRQLGEGGFSVVFLVQKWPSAGHHLQQQESKQSESLDHGAVFFFPPPFTSASCSNSQWQSSIAFNFAVFELKECVCMCASRVVMVSKLHKMKKR